MQPGGEGQGRGKARREGKAAAERASHAADKKRTAGKNRDQATEPYRAAPFSPAGIGQRPLPPQSARGQPLPATLDAVTSEALNPTNQSVEATSFETVGEMRASTLGEVQERCPNRP